MSSGGRHVTLLLCSEDQGILGALPSFDVELPYWQETADIVAAAAQQFDLDVVILRLLSVATAASGDGGPVTYLAEVATPPATPLLPWSTADPLAEQPNRMSWARPGGPQRDLAWADTVLASQGIARTGPARQIRSWNLSSIWALPTTVGELAQTAWLKVVPPFLARESSMLSLLAGSPVPRLLGADGPRVLLAEVPGEDQYHATGAPLLEMVSMLTELQYGWIGRTTELQAAAELSPAGVADWRVATLLPRVAPVLERHRAELTALENSSLDDLIAELPARAAKIDSCGIPDTLVHGDFHPGNVRGRPANLVVLDWGEAGVGHPMLDQLAFTARLSARDHCAVVSNWAARWRELIPGCDPAAAARLLSPCSALFSAVMYQGFLDHIESDERPYHALDPVASLRSALRWPA